MFVPLYTCIFVHEFYFGNIIQTQYMIYLFLLNMCKKIARKKLTKKKLLTFEWPNEPYFHKSIS
jgi:hypothetical protein